jgi:ubiquitin C-terminal hydrolase
MVPVVEKSAEPVHYKLCGVLYHHGNSEPAGSGHYSVDMLHQNLNGDSEETWLHIDDKAVSVVQHEEVFGGLENERDDQCAYMLFYCRTASART